MFRSRLEESRLLWQFYWDMAEEENWIKEMENILLQGDIGHDLTTINLLLSKHKTLETEILGHESALQVETFFILQFFFLKKYFQLFVILK